MKKLGFALAASIVVLGGCASSTPMVSVAGKSGADYAGPAGDRVCWKRNLSEKDGKLYCNWVPSLEVACLPERSMDYSTAIEMSRFSDPRPAGRCENGNYLVMVTPR